MDEKAIANERFQLKHRILSLSLLVIVASIILQVTGCQNGNQEHARKSDSTEHKREPFSEWKVEEQKWVKLLIRLPNTQSSIVFARRHAHPFLAEYDRYVVLKTPGEESLKFDLPINTGGRTNIDVYLVKSNSGDTEVWLHDLNDAKSAYVINLNEHSFRIEGEKKYWRSDNIGLSVRRGTHDLAMPQNAKKFGAIVSAAKVGLRMKFVHHSTGDT